MSVEVQIIRRTIFDPTQGGECRCTDALIKDGDRRATSRQPGWSVDEEYFKSDYIRNCKEKSHGRS